MTTTAYTARSPVGYTIRTADPAIAWELSMGGFRVPAVSHHDR